MDGQMTLQAPASKEDKVLCPCIVKNPTGRLVRTKSKLCKGRPVLDQGNHGFTCSPKEGTYGLVECEFTLSSTSQNHKFFWVSNDGGFALYRCQDLILCGEKPVVGQQQQTPYTFDVRDMFGRLVRVKSKLNADTLNLNLRSFPRKQPKAGALGVVLNLYPFDSRPVKADTAYSVAHGDGSTAIYLDSDLMLVDGETSIHKLCFLIHYLHRP